MAREKGDFAWRKLKAENTKGLRCMGCDNRLLMVIREPVARQARKMTAHHLRIIAKCPICRKIQRIALGHPK
jgi:uncharacterized protein with PIN domain